MVTALGVSGYITVIHYHHNYCHTPLSYLLNGADDGSTLQALHQPTGHTVMETTNELLGSGMEYAAAQMIVRNGSMFLRWECENSGPKSLGSSCLH